jgi:hypothetical protein
VLQHRACQPRIPLNRRRLQHPGPARAAIAWRKAADIVLGPAHFGRRRRSYIFSKGLRPPPRVDARIELTRASPVHGVGAQASCPRRRRPTLAFATDVASAVNRNRKEIEMMKAITLILALALAATAVGASAAPPTPYRDGGSMSPDTKREWYRAGTYGGQDEAQKAKLDRQGFPQYND